MGAFQNIGINAYLKRYGLKNGLLRGIYMANPIHIVRDCLLYTSDAADEL